MRFGISDSRFVIGERGNSLALAVVCAAGVAGCAPYTDAQLGLVAQAREGISLARDVQREHAGLVDELRAAQRRRLDEAFDRDVHATPDLSAEWVIEARKAYAVGVDALHAQHAANRTAAERADANLAATDAALERLAWLVGLPMTFVRDQREVRP